MRRSTLCAFTLLCALLAPLSLRAEAPKSVTGLEARLQDDGSILVEWAPNTEESVTSYRVYFSQKSILENNGYYDDVETTEGPATSRVLNSVPESFQTVFVSVMAVNAQGEESPYFTEEVRVDRGPRLQQPAASSSQTSEPATASSSSAPQAPAPSSSSLQSAPKSSGAATLRLLSAQAISKTRVGLLFSATPVIDPILAPSAFAIIDAQGAALPIEQLTIEGKAVTVQTAPQTAGAVYQMRLTEPLAGEGGMALDTVDRVAFFAGHSTGLSPEEAQARATQQQAGQQQQPATAIPGSVPLAGSLPDVVNFRLSASPQPNKLFKVTGQWTVDPSTPEGTFIVVRQSRDGGRTFSQPEFLPGNLDGVVIPNVTQENFGLAVYIADAEGHSSPGVFKAIFTWNTPQIAPPVSATVTPVASSARSASSASSVITSPPSQAKNLSQSGAGAVCGIAAFGALAGWRRMRKAK